MRFGKGCDYFMCSLSVQHISVISSKSESQKALSCRNSKYALPLKYENAMSQIGFMLIVINRATLLISCYIKLLPFKYLKYTRLSQFRFKYIC